MNNYVPNVSAAMFGNYQPTPMPQLGSMANMSNTGSTITSNPPVQSQTSPMALLARAGFRLAKPYVQNYLKSFNSSGAPGSPTYTGQAPDYASSMVSQGLNPFSDSGGAGMGSFGIGQGAENPGVNVPSASPSPMTSLTPADYGTAATAEGGDAGMGGLAAQAGAEDAAASGAASGLASSGAGIVGGLVGSYLRNNTGISEAVGADSSSGLSNFGGTAGGIAGGAVGGAFGGPAGAAAGSMLGSTFGGTYLDPIYDSILPFMGLFG